MSRLKRKAAEALTGKAKKRKAVRKPSSATQEGVRFSKGKDIKDAKPSRDEMRIEAELRTAKVAKGSRAPSATVGKKSMPNYAADQAQASPGMKARSKADQKAYAEIMAAREAGDKALEKKLRKAQEAKEAKRQKSDEKSADKSRRTASVTRSTTAKKLERGTYVNRNTGEVFEDVKSKDDLPKGARMDDYVRNPTQRQIELFARGAQRRELLKSKGLTPESDRAGAEKELKLRKDMKLMSKGGRVTKKATGAHDYRMNKGGLLLSSVDRRKKK